MRLMMMMMMMRMMMRMMLLLMMMMITDHTHGDLRPRPSCRRRHTHPPKDPDLKVNSMCCCVRNYLPDRLRPDVPELSHLSARLLPQGGAKQGAKEETEG